MQKSPPSSTGRSRVVIQAVRPEIDGGRFPAKRIAGDRMRVEADIYTDGHDVITAVLHYRKDGEGELRDVAFAAMPNDVWVAFG